MAKPARRFTFSGPAGPIEAALELPDHDRGEWVAVVSHPHPLLGGTMQNNVVVHAARALAHAGVPALRFNFRGAGQSAGEHDQGVGEQDDLRAALGEALAQHPGRSVLLAGVSFGAVVSFAVANADRRAAALIGMGVPVARRLIAPLTRALPVLIVQGELDEFGAPAELAAFARACAGPVEIRTVRGAPHLFLGHLGEVRDAIQHFAARLEPPGAGELR